MVEWLRTEKGGFGMAATGTGPHIHAEEVVTYLISVRRQLRERITAIATQEQMAEIKGAVESKVQDPQVRQELSDLVSELAQQQQELAAKLQAQEGADAQEMRRIEIQERKWRMRKSLLDREPAAVLIGGLLLIVITAALIIAMFANTAVPEILASSFLMILGFFFGQTAGRGSVRAE
ncbi:hypothetical protein [Nocardia testacea]|uniref:DUF2207 domain-containing protein n=1 Tax=Nocardia testacea TaxID=248551 RepID=A0ABW7VQS3_9NOCA